MKTYSCPHCGLEVVVHSPNSWNHQDPACPEFFDFDNGGLEGFAQRAAAACGTTQEQEMERQLAALRPIAPKV